MQTQDACIGWIISLVDAADPDAVRLSIAEPDAYLASFDDPTGMAARRADLIAALRERLPRTALADEVSLLSRGDELEEPAPVRVRTLDPMTGRVISAADRGGALRQTPRSDDRPAGRQRRCAERRVRRVHSDMATGDAVPRPASRWNGGGVGRLADRCARVWDLRRCSVLRRRYAKTSRRCGNAMAGALEQWADRRTDQQTEDPQASHVAAAPVLSCSALG